MKTFKQIINEFLDGATSGIEGELRDRYSKPAIKGDTLIWITADNTHIIAIRLGENVILKTVAWETLQSLGNMTYLIHKAKAADICLVRSICPVVKNSEFDTEFKKAKERIKKQIEAELINKSDQPITMEPMGTKQALKYFGLYLKKLKAKNQAQMDRDALQLSVRVLAILEKEKVTNTHLLIKDDYTNFINITNRARNVLERMDKYIQVLITLPEIISSPKENLLRPDEHPGGDDSGPLVNH